MGEASMRKWMRRAKAAIIEPRKRLADMTALYTGAPFGSIPVPVTERETRATSLHLRLRHRRWRAFSAGWTFAERRGARAWVHAALNGGEITTLSWAGNLA